VPASSSSLSPLIATISRAAASAEELSAAQAIRLLQALSAVPDPRKGRDRRHSVHSILLVAVSAVLAGARSCAAIADWAVPARPAVRGCGSPPSGATIRRVLMGRRSGRGAGGVDPAVAGLSRRCGRHRRANGTAAQPAAAGAGRGRQESARRPPPGRAADPIGQRHRPHPPTGGAGPQIMAALRNTAINVSRLAGHSNIAAAQTPLQLDTRRRHRRDHSGVINKHHRRSTPITTMQCPC
jgi:hypothetical protein